MTTSTTPASIPFFRYPHLFQQQRDEILQAVVNVMERGAYILQSDLRDFEAALEQFLGVHQAVGVANGTDGLIIALRASGVRAGDEVIVPSHTYVASAASIHFVGATPVLVDCLDDHLIDPAAVAAAVTPRTTAIMPVQLNGRTCDMDALQRVADRHKLVIVEDAAQGLGAKFRGRAAGTFGAAAEFSFYPAKVLGCFGDGGAVTTNDPAVARRLMLLRDHGRDAAGEVVTWGLNSRLDNLQAAILNVKLRHFPQEIERRRAIARRYRQGLEHLDDLLLPPGPEDDPDHFDVYQNYEIEAGRRDELRAHLERAGVRTIIQWAGKAVHQFEGLGLDTRRFHLPRTERLFQRCFLLPMNTSLTDDEVDYICETICQFYGRPA
ncbi:MAG TPA: DegT/DnrJ/EryC1/StrS family aminotransferase [Gemmatimonadales bacterium]|nr:DegT/DnrJ/EryC1/StrS family aminotransferase [Gemmatimonadales bacterium]